MGLRSQTQAFESQVQNARNQHRELQSYCQRIKRDVQRLNQNFEQGKRDYERVQIDVLEFSVSRSGIPQEPVDECPRLDSLQLLGFDELTGDALWTRRPRRIHRQFVSSTKAL